MKRKNIESIYLFSFLFVPILTLASPSWLKVLGLGPCWPVLWLLPWSLKVEIHHGFLTSLCLGLMLDSIQIGPYSQVPSLIILSIFWGYLGQRSSYINRSMKLGFLAWMGSMLYGMSLLIQFLFIPMDYRSLSIYNWGINNLLSQSILTGLVAPFLCSIFLNYLTQKR